MPTVRLMSCRTEGVRPSGAPVACPTFPAAHTWWVTGLQPPPSWAYPTVGVLAVARVGLEIFCHAAGRRSTSLSAIGSTIRTWLPGRLVLIALWGLARWQLFACSMLPG